MGVSTGTIVKFYTIDNQLVNKYNLDDRSDDYIYDGLVCDGGANFNPDKYGDFTDEQKEIMKVYFDEESMSVGEGYAKVTSNIQSPEKLLPIWIKIRSSVIKPFQADLKSYHSQIIADYKQIKDKTELFNSSKKGLFSKNTFNLHELTNLKSEYDFENILWRTIWQIDRISKVIALLIAAKENKMLVEITVADY
jgi:hypothetical protein